MELNIQNRDLLETSGDDAETSEDEWDDGLDQTFVKIQNGDLSNMEYSQLDNEVIKITQGSEAVRESKIDDKNIAKRWIAFMAHIQHEHYDYLETQLKKLEAPYIISAEAGKYEHFHFLARITDKQYHNYVMNVFKSKFKLLGRATKTKPRQYGKVKEIKDLKRMMRYTIKDKNFRTNMTDEYIQKIIECKIEEVENKKTNQDIRHKLIAFIDDKVKNDIWAYKITHREHSSKYLKIIIIDWLRERNVPITRNQIDRYYWIYLTYTELPEYKQNSRALYEELYEQC